MVIRRLRRLRRFNLTLRRSSFCSSTNDWGQLLNGWHQRDAYAEARLFDDSVGPQGEEGFDVLAIGVHYGFSLKGFHRR